MSLIADIKKLRELEQRATQGMWHAYAGCVRSKTPTEIIDGLLHIITEYTPIAELGIDGQKNRTADSEFISTNRNLAPAMLSVLACFRDGDAERLERASERLRIESIGWREEDRLDAKEDIDAYRRLQKAASLMEQES